MTSYYELHVTMQAEEDGRLTSGMRSRVRAEVERLGWRFSAIDGDANLGDGVKLYATRQLSARRYTDESCIELLHETARILAKLPGVTVVRRKVERVIYDDRSSKVRAACDGACPECRSDDVRTGRDDMQADMEDCPVCKNRSVQSKWSGVKCTTPGCGYEFCY